MMHIYKILFIFFLPFLTIQQFSWCIGRETEPYNSKTKRYQTEILDMKGVGMICKKVGEGKAKDSYFLWSGVMELVLKNGSSCDTLMADVRVWTAKSPEDGSSLV